MSPIKSRCLLLFLLAVSAPTYAQTFSVTAADGATFYQLDFPGNSPPVNDSPVGLLETNLLRLRASSGLPSGYVNVVLDGDWVVRNLVVPLEQDFPYSQLSTQFDLGVAAGTDVSTLRARVTYSATVAQQAPAGSPGDFPVLERVIATGGTQTGAGGSAAAPDVSSVLFGDVTNNRSIFQLDHPNVEAALNQCFPMSVANSLQFLADTTDLELPHSHVPGLRGDNSLVGQLDLAMNRTAASRTSGSGVFDERGLEGKLRYLAQNGLQDRIQTRHWGQWSGSATESQSVDGRTATSTGGGAAIPLGEIVNSLERGEDCEASYYWPGGAHAVDIVAAGYVNGQPWIIENSDIDQSSDSSGAGPQGFIFSHLKDTDGDGMYNMNGKDNLHNLICQRYIPPPPPAGGSDTTFPPPWDDGDAFVVDGATLNFFRVIDPSNHSCCADPPPSTVRIRFADDRITLEGNASWLPISAPFTGNSFSGENTAPVAGFANSRNTLAGTLRANRIEATISLGTNGALPGGQAISWEVGITPPTAWPWPAFDTNTGIKPRLRVNGFRHSVRVPLGAPISLNLSLDAGGLATPADWFLAAQTSSGDFLSYGLNGTWTPGLKPTLQGPLRDLGNTPAFQQLGGLPGGSYTLYFAVDTNVNGTVDMGSVVYDTVSLTVE